MSHESPKNPVEAEIAHCLSVPYPEVVAIFDTQTFQYQGNIRGGTYVGEKTTLKDPQFITSNFHTEMTPTHEQLPFIRTGMRLLERLTEGNVQGVPNKYPPFEDEIIAAYNTPELHNYAADLRKATSTLYDRFQQEYPTLMPALKKTFDIAGAEGTAFFISKAIEALMTDRENGNQIHANSLLKEHARNMKHGKFIGRHGKGVNPTYPPFAYEVVCLGERLARKLTTNAVSTGLKIAEKDAGFLASLTLPNHVETVMYFREHVHAIAQQTAIEQVL